EGDVAHCVEVTEAAAEAFGVNDDVVLQGSPGRPEQLHEGRDAGVEEMLGVLEADADANDDVRALFLAEEETRGELGVREDVLHATFDLAFDAVDVRADGHVDADLAGAALGDEDVYEGVVEVGDGHG